MQHLLGCTFTQDTVILSIFLHETLLYHIFDCLYNQNVGTERSVLAGAKKVGRPERGDKSNGGIHPLPATMVAVLQYLIEFLLSLSIALVVVARTFSILWESGEKCALLTQMRF